MLFRTQPQQHRPDQRTGREIERRPRLCSGLRQPASIAWLRIGSRTDRSPAEDALPPAGRPLWRAPLPRTWSATPRGARDDRRRATAERRQSSSRPRRAASRHRHVVDRLAGRQLVEEPEALLCERETPLAFGAGARRSPPSRPESPPCLDPRRLIHQPRRARTRPTAAARHRTLPAPAPPGGRRAASARRARRTGSRGRSRRRTGSQNLPPDLRQALFGLAERRLEGDRLGGHREFREGLRGPPCRWASAADGPAASPTAPAAPGAADRALRRRSVSAEAGLRRRAPRTPPARPARAGRTTAASPHPRQARSAASTSPGSMRKPRILSWRSRRPR